MNIYFIAIEFELGSSNPIDFWYGNIEAPDAASAKIIAIDEAEKQDIVAGVAFCNKI